MTQPSSANIWHHKPWWCQPWSIILTGLGAIALSWWLFKALWLTLALALVVLAWWGLFLVLVPKVYAQGEWVTPVPESSPSQESGPFN